MTDGIELGFYYQYAIFMDTFLDPPPPKKKKSHKNKNNQTNKKKKRIR